MLKTSIMIVIALSLTSSIFATRIIIPAKKNNFNRGVVVQNLLNGINSENQGLKLSSAYFLGQYKSSEAVIPLLSILKNDKSEESRIMAALSLIKIGDLRGIYAIKQAVKFDSSERVRKLCQVFYSDYLLNKE